VLLTTHGFMLALPTSSACVQEPEAPAIRSAISQSFFLPGVPLDASPADGLRYQIKRRRITFSMDLENVDQILEVICARLF
jgi:hypothetical protein